MTKRATTTLISLSRIFQKLNDPVMEALLRNQPRNPPSALALRSSFQQPLSKRRKNFPKNVQKEGKANTRVRERERERERVLTVDFDYIVITY